MSTAINSIQQFTTFRIGREWFGLDISHVQEVMQPIEMNPIPLAPKSIVGLVNVRGIIVTCISLKEKLSFSDCSYAKNHRYIIVNDPEDGTLVCLLVDEIGDVIEVNEQDVQSSNTTGTSLAQSAVTGILKLQKQLVSIIDIKAILADS